jgi:transposase
MPILAHRIRLEPNQEAVRYLSKACCTARFAYNWALGTWKEKYSKGQKGISAYSLDKKQESKANLNLLNERLIS